MVEGRFADGRQEQLVRTFFLTIKNRTMGNFKNLRVWQEGIDLAEAIYKIT